MKKKTKTQQKRTTPLMVESFSFAQMLDKIKHEPAEPKPMTKEKQAELESLLKQLKESQGPGDAFFMLQIKK